MNKITIPDSILEVLNKDLVLTVEALQDNATLTAVKTDEESEKAAKVIKIAKEITTEAKKQKKKVEEPFERARKEADAALNSAKNSKKTAGEPFLSIISMAEQIETNYRGYISLYLATKEQERQKVEREKQLALQEAERLRLEAIDAASSEEPEEVQMVDFLEEQSTIQQQKAAAIQSVDTKGPVAFRVDIEPIIENIDLVPDSYFDDNIDFAEINKVLTTKFKGLLVQVEQIEILNKSEVDPLYLIQEININRIKHDLKNDESLVIPGIKRDFKHIPIIR